MVRKVVFGLMLLGSIGLAAVPYWFFIGREVHEYFSRIPFDSTGWKDPNRPDTKNPVRLRMVDDLLQPHNLVGKSKAEIDEILGVPSKSGGIPGYDYVYWLGQERSCMPIDYELLVIKFEQDRVVLARVIAD